MSLADIADSIDVINRARAVADAFGHLAPEPGRVYTGTMILAEGWYSSDGLVPVRVEFDGLPASPWLYNDLGEWLCDTQQGTEPGQVYRWAGTYRKFRNGRYRFTGRLRRVEL